MEVFKNCTCETVRHEKKKTPYKADLSCGHAVRDISVATKIENDVDIAIFPAVSNILQVCYG